MSDAWKYEPVGVGVERCPDDMDALTAKYPSLEIGRRSLRRLRNGRSAGFATGGIIHVDTPIIVGEGGCTYCFPSRKEEE